MQSKALPGFRDFYPADAALLNHIMTAWRSVSARYGFEEYGGPPLEPLELYTAKSGDEIVEQLYHFEDKGNRAIALRPEITPTLARMVAARATDFKKPIRWFAIPQLFRYERQQRGRLREHFQFNMDLIGESGPLADAEIIAAAIDVLRTLGFGASDIRARVSDRRVLAALLTDAGVDEAQLIAAYGVIDKIEREDPDRLLGRLTEHGLPPEAAHRVLEIGALRGYDAVVSALRAHPQGDAVGEGLRVCHDALVQMGLGEFVEVDLSIVRGLAYYTGIVFELFDTGKTLRAICGGGRYDGLLGALGGVDLPAVGFGMGDVVLGELLRDRGVAPEVEPRLDVFLVAVTTSDQATVLQLSHALRDSGIRVEYALKAQAVGKQLKIAAARGARWAVVVGPDERERNETTVRDLEAGTEQVVALSDVRVTISDQSACA